MSLLDDIFGVNRTPQSPNPAQVGSPGGAASAPINQADQFALMQKMANTLSASGPQGSGLLGLLSWADGAQRDALRAKAAAMTPLAFEQYKAQLDANQASGMGNARTAAMLAAGTGTQPLDLNNPQSPNGIVSLANAFRTAFPQNAQPGVSPVAPDASAPPTSAADSMPFTPPSVGAPPSGVPLAPFNPVAAAGALSAVTNARRGLVPAEIMARVPFAESNNNPNTPDSPTGAQGLMQVEPVTQRAPGYGVTPSNGTAADTVREGKDYLSAMWNKYDGNSGQKNAAHALMAYNWGPGNVDKWIASGSDPSKVPAETVKYLNKVMGQAAAPTGGPVASAAPDPALAALQADRARQIGFANMSAMAGDPAGAAASRGLADVGLLPGQRVSGAGATIDSNTGQTISVNQQQYTAGGAFGQARSTEAGTDAATPVQVRTATGFTTVHKGDLAGMPANSYAVSGSDLDKSIQAAQDADITPAREAATTSDSQEQLITQLRTAAAGAFTGTGSGTFQNWQKTLLSIASAAGVDIDPKTIARMSAFEQMKYISQQVVAKGSHDVSARPAMAIYTMLNNVKPGEFTSPKGLLDIIDKQMIPVNLRAKAIYAQEQQYYQDHPMARDGSTVVQAHNPITKFTLKTPDQPLNKGDYFRDSNGEIRQAGFN